MLLHLQIVPAVTELIVAQLMWLDYDNPSKPLYLYINSPGTHVNTSLDKFFYDPSKVPFLLRGKILIVCYIIT